MSNFPADGMTRHHLEGAWQPVCCEPGTRARLWLNGWGYPRNTNHIYVNTSSRYDYGQALISIDDYQNAVLNATNHLRLLSLGVICSTTLDLSNNSVLNHHR